jgi:hypothetical protein
VRTPQTLQLPVVGPAPKSAELHSAQKKTHKKNAAANAQTMITAPVAK